MKTALVGASVIDGSGSVARSANVIVQDNKIIAVDEPLAPLPPDTDVVVDLDGRTLLPGLIDTHIHCVGGDYVPGYEHDDIATAILKTAAVMRRTLQAGITTVRTAGSRDYLDVVVRDAVIAGEVPGPRMLASGRGLTITGGHLAGVCLEVDSIPEMVKGVREHLKARVDSVKVMMSGGTATAGREVTASQFTRQEATVIVQEAQRGGCKVLTHAIGGQAIRVAVAAGVVSFVLGYLLVEETAVAMRDKGTYLVPTFSPGHYYTRVRQAEPWRIARSEATWPLRRKAFELAMRVGVPIAMGSDCGAQSRMPNGRNALELALMVEHGMEPAMAIQAGTSSAATLLGLDDVGRIAPGFVADLIVVDGDPLTNIELLEQGIVLVMQAGTVIRDDLHLYDHARASQHGQKG